ncbi:MAG: DUF378 domain-containing protein [Chlamydiales bacterium]|nr:DUF378 domain-containing protein [Chlamydiales bacterium]
MKKCVSTVAMFLVVIGALNWGLWGFFQFDLVAWLCKGNTNWMSRVIYSIIGLAGVWSLKLCCCKSCGSGCSCKSDKKGGGCCR